MLTTRPLVARSCARKAWVTLNTPLRLTAMMSCQSLITASGSAVKVASLRPTAASAISHELAYERMVGWWTDHEPQPGGLALLRLTLCTGLAAVAQRTAR